MKATDKIIELINSLINLTKHTQLKWDVVTDYMDTSYNERLKHYMISNNEYYDAFDSLSPYLSEFNSFCSQINTGVVFLFTYHSRKKEKEYYILGVQNSNYGEIIELNTEDTYQDELYKLKYHSKNSVDSIDLFVDTIIAKSKMFND